MTACPAWVGDLPAPEDDPKFVQWAELYELFGRMNADEREIVLAVARQTMGRGREEYGQARIADGRNDAAEAFAELRDALWYAAKGALRLSKTKTGG